MQTSELELELQVAKQTFLSLRRQAMLMFSRVQAQIKLYLEKGKVQSVVFGSISLIHFPLKTLLQCIAKMVIFIMSLGRSNITRSQFQPGHFLSLWV